MSQKRTPTESGYNEQTNEVVFQQDDNTKHARLSSVGNATLQDLPTEMLECILLEAVIEEVKGMKLVKSVWEEKADLVINRHTTVCLQWNSILTTSFFRSEIHRILDGTADETIRLEMLHQLTIKSAIRAMTTMKDEIFMLCELHDRDYVINIYNRNNMEEEKDVIPLPGTHPVYMAACNVSNCVYVGLESRNCLCLSVLRISKDAEHQFNIISPWITDHRLSISMISVSANGNLIILSLQQGQDPDVVSIYDVNGSLQREVRFPPDIDAFRYKNVIEKSNGNLILVYVAEQNYQTTLLEIDTIGQVVFTYESSFSEESFVNYADIYGRIMITEPQEGIQLLDSEFNDLGIYNPQKDEDKRHIDYDWHYESERNEIVRIHYDWNTKNNVLTIFRFIEELTNRSDVDDEDDM